MEKRGRSRFRTAITMLAVLTVVAAAFVLEGILVKGTDGRWPWFFGASVQSSLTAQVTQIQKFVKCGDVATGVTEVPKAKLPETLATLGPGWVVTESSETSAVARKDVDAYCPDHRDFRLIALYRWTPAEEVHVCVFRGTKVDSAFITKERRDLTEATLYPQDRARLRAGLLVTREPQDPVDSDLDEKVDTYLQGIGEGR